jgi:hypothetical protein
MSNSLTHRCLLRVSAFCQGVDMMPSQRPEALDGRANEIFNLDLRGAGQFGESRHIPFRLVRVEINTYFVQSG